MPLSALMRSVRLPFLILTPVCVFLGGSIVFSAGGAIDPYLFGLALLGALLAHTSVNTLNEYLDFKSGLDLTTRKTPFSGGSGALPDTPQAAAYVKALGLVSLLATALIGIFFAWNSGPEILPIGLLGLFIIGAYTPWINRHAFICLIAPGLGFGVLMVVGTQFVLSGTFLELSWLIALVPFFLINNLLLLNQYPDKAADEKVGRRHFPIRFGIAASNVIYGLFAGATVVAIILYVQQGLLPPLSLIALLPMTLAAAALAGALKHGENIGHHPHFLGMNVGASILTPLLLGISLTVQ